MICTITTRLHAAGAKIKWAGPGLKQHSTTTQAPKPPFLGLPNIDQSLCKTLTKGEMPAHGNDAEHEAETIKHTRTSKVVGLSSLKLYLDYPIVKLGKAHIVNTPIAR